MVRTTANIKAAKSLKSFTCNLKIYCICIEKYTQAEIEDIYATLLHIFDKMPAVGHFGYPKFTFDHISGHFTSIRIFF